MEECPYRGRLLETSSIQARFHKFGFRTSGVVMGPEVEIFMETDSKRKI